MLNERGWLYVEYVGRTQLVCCLTVLGGSTLGVNMSTSVVLYSFTFFLAFVFWAIFSLLRFGPYWANSLLTFKVIVWYWAFLDWA